MTKKKILYIIPRFSSGSSQMLVLEYVKSLVADGYEVAVASAFGGGELAMEFREITKEVLVGGKKSPVGFYKNILKQREFLKRWQPDVVHTHHLAADLCGYFLKKKKGSLRWLTTIHNIEYDKSFWKKFVWKKLLQKVNLVIAVSEQVEKFYLQKFDVPTQKLVVLRNGIELEDWFELKAEDILQKEELLLANIGRLEYQKGQDVLLRALYKVRDLKWRLYIYGDGSWQEKLKKMADSLGLKDRVKFKGVTMNLPYEMPEIDVVIQPSRWEGQSLVIMEAMAAGRGIIASAQAAEGLIVADKMGLVVKKEDTDALADAIRTVIIKKDKIKTMAIEAQKFARLHFSIESHMEKLKRIYDYL